LIRREFSPESYYEELYKENIPALTFTAKNIREWKRWKRKLRQKIKETLGSFPKEKVDLKPEVLEREELDGYIREKVVFESEKRASIPAYLLIPAGLKKPAGAVIALHGHGPGKTRPAGIAETKKEKEVTFGGERDYALQAVKHNYLAIAPDLRAFGERRNPDDIGANKENSCRDSLLHSIMFGKTLVGERVFDVARCIDYLNTREEVDKKRICCLGQSGGGTTALFSAALDDRIKVAVISGYFCTFKDSILSIHHCECNYIPGILRWAEMYDLAGLIAPRPLLIVAGKDDGIFPIKGVEFAYKKLKNIYRIANCKDKVKKYIGDGGHRFYAQPVWDFLSRWL